MLNRRHRTPFRHRLLRIPVKRGAVWRGSTTTRSHGTRRTSAFSRATLERERPLHFLSRHHPTLFSILPSLLLPSPFFCIFHDDASIEILLPLRSSDFKLAVQSSDTSHRRRGRRRRQPPTNILGWLFRGGGSNDRAPANCRFSDEFWWIIESPIPAQPMRNLS